MGVASSSTLRSAMQSFSFVRVPLDTLKVHSQGSNPLGLTDWVFGTMEAVCRLAVGFLKVPYLGAEGGSGHRAEAVSALTSRTQSCSYHRSV